ncbi:hypothetical protein EYZ11_004620 [Aspergillus tanneri]|nr:hypothetical protein EYZ11_004620 [Aspergillus tanneri]
MSEEVISSLCEQFVIRLRDNSSSNHRQHRFFRNGTGSEVFHSNQQDLRELLRHLCQFHAISLDLLPLLVQRTLSDLSTVFAILLWVRGRHEVPVLRQFLDLILEAAGRGDGATLKVTDDDLPLSRSTATGTFPLKGAEFYEKQFKFCAVTLVKREEVIYKDDRCKCPLPYLEESRIGEGAFGQVWSVRIEKRHLQSRGKHTETTVALEYARKDFQLNQEQAFQEEREILNRILDQPRRHRNIMVALASLQYGNTYSLFFDLASCNLAEYLHAEDHSPPWSWEEKCAIYRRGVTLAGALAFLHTEFRNQSLEMLSCYHLDLKPHNILVFNAYTSSEEWKITDFGLSRVKGRRHGGDEDVALVMPFLRKAQWGPRHFQEPSTMNRRGEGTYLAPECSLPNGRVSSASDVWSFGCIFSLVMSYIDAGRSGVVAFATKRRQQEHGDSFYTIKRRGREPELSPVVKNWFSHLKKRASASPHVMEGKVVGRTLDFLQKDVLHPKRDRRVMATRLEAELSEISRRFYQPLEISGSRVKKWRFSHSKQPPYIPQHQKLPLDQSLGIQSSLFAPGGDLLVIHSLPKAQVFSPNEIVSSMEEHAAIPKPRLILLPNARLECIANSSTLICACLAVPYFECYFYVASESSLTSLPNNARVYRPHMGSIKKVAISADGEWAAFIITRSPYGPDSDALVYLLRTKDLVGVSSDA